MAAESNEVHGADPHGPIFVVDDNPDFRDALQDVLTDNGREVVLAENGRDALTKLAARRPCLILLDLMMPVMDGFEFLDQLQNLHSDIPVLVVSAHDTVVRGQRYPHVLGTLSKPFPIPELLSFVNANC